MAVLAAPTNCLSLVATMVINQHSLLDSLLVMLVDLRPPIRSTLIVFTNFNHIFGCSPLATGS